MGLFLRLFRSRKRKRQMKRKKNKKMTMNNDEQLQTAEVSSIWYEQYREKRIKENMEKMKLLGLFDLSSKLHSMVKRKSSSYTKQSSTTSLSSMPLRKSSRLQNLNHDSSIVEMDRRNDKEYGEDDLRSLIKKGSKPEIYTEEREKLLGSCKSTWTLLVDGYGKNGKRLHDSIHGKTCHQCRQKTLGHRTSCAKCKRVRGQFCGDCLYMRYGEHVLEVNENPNWICPVCRGICNCSLCRSAKGWLPTNILYTKVSKLGFKSVAHFLIQTLRADDSSSSADGSKANESTNNVKGYGSIMEEMNK